MMAAGSVINQSIHLFVQKCNRHWTGHQWSMQPPLTGVEIQFTMLVKATNDNLPLKNPVNSKIVRSNVYHKIWQSLLKAKNTVGLILSGNLFRRFRTRLFMEHTSITNIQWYFFSIVFLDGNVAWLEPRLATCWVVVVVVVVVERTD